MLNRNKWKIEWLSKILRIFKHNIIVFNRKRGYESNKGNGEWYDITNRLLANGLMWTGA